jgi:CDP-diacylglycerol--glycerol-3-phosphate 3-phosphatidyltransferase
MYAGILSDIFDGIIARKLNISTENLRLLDTFIDLLFYIALLIYILSRNPLILSDNLSFISIILFLEGLMYAISLIRFKKIPSPHAILSKFWGIYLVIEFTLLLLDVKGVHFKIALLFGILAHVDRVLIYSFLREWDHDIPSTFHALQLRAGKSIKRRKLFNG